MPKSKDPSEPGSGEQRRLQMVDNAWLAGVCSTDGSGRETLAFS